jgi:spermidine/putrescine transport system permease protein
VGLPLAYFIATRAGRRKGVLILLLVVPFWTSFLIRTYAWLLILGPNLGLAGQISALTGIEDVQILGTPFAVLLGLVYGYLPLMVFPLYVTLERMDRTLVEASKDLGAGRWATFRQVTLPIALPGLVTGSILVFIPMMGEYVIPQLLGFGRTYLMGNALVTDFLESRNWPAGSARAMLLIGIMIVTIAGYLWFVNRGRRTREVSVL